MRQAFRDQASFCERLKSPFTAALCHGIADVISSEDAVGRALLAWPGDASPLADNLPLRVTGALHALARAGADRNLVLAFPPNGIPNPPTLAAVLRAVFQEHADAILAFIGHTPQTNEVGRSGVLIGGFLTIAERTKLPLALFEIGASAGLNLLPDRYRYRLGAAEWGPDTARLVLAPDWSGPLPPVTAPLTVAARRGCDVNPIDLNDAAERERLRSYVWPDQQERMRRLDAAIGAALDETFTVDRADAAVWVERAIPVAAPPANVVRTLFHSIVWGYLPQPSRERIESHMRKAGAAATDAHPLAWLRFELDTARGEAVLLLTQWPGGREELLASAHPHGSFVRWHAG